MGGICQGDMVSPRGILPDSLLPGPNYYISTRLALAWEQSLAFKKQGIALARAPKSSVWFSWIGRHFSQHRVLPPFPGLPLYGGETVQ